MGAGSERSLDGSAGFEPTLADWGGSRASTAPSQAESQPEATSGPAAPPRPGSRPGASGVPSGSPLGSGRDSLLTRTPEQARSPVTYHRPGFRCKANKTNQFSEVRHVTMTDLVYWTICGVIRVLRNFLGGCDCPS